MNKREFLEALSKTPRDWFLTESGKIRRKHFQKDDFVLYECPISSIKSCQVGEYFTVSSSLGIAPTLRGSIVYAADKPGNLWGWFFFGNMRSSLLKACSLR